MQLAKFSKQVLRENIPAKQYISEFADWEKAFRALLELPYGDKKKLVVIDEFSYMCKGNRSVPSILQNLWDTVFKESSVMLILCGSAMSFIEKELLAEKNPLYGRATGIYKMKKMGFYDSAVSAKYSCGFPNPQASDIIVVDKYLDYFTTIMEDRLWQVLAKPCILRVNRSSFTDK